MITLRRHRREAGEARSRTAPPVPGIPSGPPLTRGSAPWARTKGRRCPRGPRRRRRGRAAARSCAPSWPLRSDRPTAAAPDAALPTAARDGQSAGGAHRAGATAASHWQKRRAAARGRQREPALPSPHRPAAAALLGAPPPPPPRPLPPGLPASLTSLRKGGTQPDTSRSVKTPLCYKVHTDTRRLLPAQSLAGPTFPPYAAVGGRGGRISAASGPSAAAPPGGLCLRQVT